MQAEHHRSTLPAFVLAATVVWTIAVIGRIAGGLNFGHYFDRWLGFDLAILPLPQAAIGHFKRICAAAVITLSLLGVGRLLLKTLRFAAHNPWEEAVLSFGLGYGAVGTLMFLLGLVGLWRGGFLISFLVALALAALPGLNNLLGSVRVALRRSSSVSARPDAFNSCAAAFIVLEWLYLLRYALIPETFYDALVYHLALPAQYLLHGRIYPTPLNSYSGVPALPQMLSGLALAIEPWGIAASILHSSLLLWCCVALVGLSRRLGRPKTGVLAAAIFAATPVVIAESFRVSVGLEWTLMELCCLTGVLAVAEESGGLSMPAVVLAGSFLGFAMATKYPAWLLAIAVIPPLAFERLSTVEERKRFSMRLLVLGLTALALIVPWVLKNIVFYRNPLYPFFHEHFAAAGAAMPDWRQINAAGTDLRRFLTPGGLWNYVTHPWGFLKPLEDVTETTGPVYLALLPGLLLFPFERRGKLVALFALAAWIPLSVLSLQPRFFIPHLAVVALLVAYLIEGLEPRWTAVSFRAGAMGLAALSALGWAVMDSNRAKLPVYLGIKDFNEYLAHTVVSYPTPPYAGYQFLNEQTPMNTKVLVYSESRGFYLKREAIISSADQRTELESWADESADAAALARKIREEGVSFILVNAAEISRLKQAPRVTPAGLRVLNDFWMRYTDRAFGVLDPRDRWVGVYKILDDVQAARPHPVDDFFGQYLKKSS